MKPQLNFVDALCFNSLENVQQTVASAEANKHTFTCLK